MFSKLDRVLGLIVLFALFFLIASRVNGQAACNTDCRLRTQFIQLGKGGGCFAYTSATCSWCANQPNSVCLNNGGVLPGTCKDTMVANEFRSITDCGGACVPTPGLNVMEATGTPAGKAAPSVSNIYLCK